MIPDFIIEKKDTGKLLAGSRALDLFASGKGVSEDAVQGRFMERKLYPLPVTAGDEIVWGFDIAEAAAKHGEETLYCRDIVNRNPDRIMKLETALYCENRKGKYSWDEKEKIYLYIKDYMEGNPGQTVTSLVQEGSSFIPAAALYSSLPSGLKRLTGNGLFDLKTANTCRVVPDDAFVMMSEYLEKLSHSSRRIFIINLAEIIQRDSLDNRQATALVKVLLGKSDPAHEARLLRHPVFTETEAKFNEISAAALKNTGIVLDPPPYFEGDSYRVEFSFRNRKQLERIISSLRLLGEKADELFRLL